MVIIFKLNRLRLGIQYIIQIEIEMTINALDSERQRAVKLVPEPDPEHSSEDVEGGEHII